MIEIPHCKNAGESTFQCTLANLNLFLLVIIVIDSIAKAALKVYWSNMAVADAHICIAYTP